MFGFFKRNPESGGVVAFNNGEDGYTPADKSCDPLPVTYKKVLKSTLYIKLETGGGVDSISFEVEIDTKKEKLEHYKDFYLWYVSRTTPFYIYHYKDGLTMLQRDRIISFDIRVTEHSIAVEVSK